MKLNVPEALKVLLVDDWEAITKNNQARLSLIGCMHLLHHSSLFTCSVCGCCTNAACPAPSDAKRGRSPPRVQRACREDGETDEVCHLCVVLWHVAHRDPNSLRDPDLVLPTIISGLTVYFDRSLGANLLYRFERPQYAEMRKAYVTGPKVQVGQEKDMSAIYGAEHLLRMLGMFP